MFFKKIKRGVPHWELSIRNFLLNSLQCGIKMVQILIKPKIRRWLQLRTIKSLTKSLPEGKWWLFGGWAIEVITGEKSPHKDIDIGILENAASELKIPYTKIKKTRYLEIGTLYEEDNPNVSIAGKEYRWIFLRKRGEFFIGCTHLGTFYIPREALENKPRSLHGVKVYTASPELLYLITRSPKQKRRRDLQNLAILRNFIDNNKLKELEKTFLFRPKQPSPMHP